LVQLSLNMLPLGWISEYLRALVHSRIDRKYGQFPQLFHSNKSPYLIKNHSDLTFLSIPYK
jgi:hypothetical protein